VKFEDTEFDEIKMSDIVTKQKPQIEIKRKFTASCHGKQHSVLDMMLGSRKEAAKKIKHLNKDQPENNEEELSEGEPRPDEKRKRKQTHQYEEKCMKKRKISSTQLQQEKINVVIKQMASGTSSINVCERTPLVSKDFEILLNKI